MRKCAVLVKFLLENIQTKQTAHMSNVQDFDNAFYQHDVAFCWHSPHHVIWLVTLEPSEICQ